MAEPLTIDNLPIDVSTQYAQGREAYDESLMKESFGIGRQTQVDVTSPFLPSEFEALFGLGEKGATWPLISPPPNYSGSRRPIFAQQTIPGLGSLEAQEKQIERLEAMGEEEMNKRSNPQDADEVNREIKTLLNLLGKVLEVDQDKVEINAKRVQYQKG